MHVCMYSMCMLYVTLTLLIHVCLSAVNRALEKEKENINALNNAYKVVCQQLESNEESKNSTIQSLNEQIETLKREILIPPVSEKSSFPEPEFEKDRLFSALKSSVELVFITKQISTHIHNSGVVVTDSSANLPSDIAGMIEVYISICY